MISMDADDLRQLLQDRIDLRRRVNELLDNNSTLVRARRVVDWYYECKSMFYAFNQEVPETPKWPSLEIMKMRRTLLIEEVDETLEAIETGDFVEVVDGCIDIMVVTVGLLIACGVDARPMWTEVMKTNFAKAKGPRRADGKIMKPAGWVPPDIKGELEKQGWVPKDAPWGPEDFEEPEEAQDEAE